MKHGKITICIASVLLCLLLGGCRGTDAEQYFSLPRQAGEFTRLQELIEEELADGAAYAAPLGGEWQQPVLLCDPDGSGEDEALVFLRNAEGRVDIHLYTVEGGAWRQALILPGEGPSIARVALSDVNQDGSDELIVSWQMGEGLRLLSVYDLRGWGGEQLLSCRCNEFVTGDLDGDGEDDLLVVNLGSEGGRVDIYAFPPNNEPVHFSSRLSRGVQEIQRLLCCTLADGTPALLAESWLEDGSLVSDLFVEQDGVLSNIALGGEGGVARTRRTYAVFSEDIDGDGTVEIPYPSSLFTQSAGAYFWAIIWNSYDRTGRVTEKFSTFHCYSDGWYFRLPTGWRNILTVRREDAVPGERCVVFSEVNRSTGEIADMLAVYTLTGENRADRAGLSGRFVLLEEDSVIYAARIYGGVTEEEMRENFALLYPAPGAASE